MSSRPFIDRRDLVEMGALVASFVASVVRFIVLLVAIMALAWSVGSLAGIALYALRVVNGWT